MSVIVDGQIHLFDPANLEHARQIGQSPLTPVEVIEQMTLADVDRAYLVPSGSGANDVCLDAARRWPDRFNVMGSIALNKPMSRDLIPGWRAAGFTGVRLTFPPFRDPSWLRDGTADWFWPAAEAAGLPVMIWAPEQADEIARIAREHPGLRLLVDHLNLFVDDKGAEAVTITESILPLAELPNVAVKASAMPAHSREQFPFRDIHPAIELAYDAFGADRLFWGTDLTRLPCTMDQARDMFVRHLDFIDPEDLPAVMGEGILRWLGWRDPSSHV